MEEATEETTEDTEPAQRYWDQLTPNWQRAMHAALAGYIAGSAPIGAIVVNQHGQVIARGNNQFAQNRLAHAEVEALRQVPEHADRKRCALYTTLEPCPMCTSAVRLMQLDALHYAAQDPAAGAANMLSSDEFMRKLPCTIHPPADPLLAFINITLLVEYRTRTKHARWRDKWLNCNRAATLLGESLAQQQQFVAWRQSKATPVQIYSDVARQFDQLTGSATV